MITKEQVLDALRSVIDPELHRNIVDLGMVREIDIQPPTIKVTIALTIPNCPLRDKIAQDAAEAVDALSDDINAEILLTAMNDEERQRVQETLRGERQQRSQSPAGNLNRVKTVIAVMSGKGGVGKSSVAAMLAVGLRRTGLRVGVLDSDITGPSIPLLFGMHEPPTSGPLGILPPQSSTGVKIMSINLMLQNEEDAVIWRGPMIAGAINQFWNDVFWGDLDTLIVDMPPGTSDAALTVMQGLPVTGIILVTSPQDLAEMVVRKAANMAQHMQIPLIGIIENMSYVVCPKCGERFEPFGTGNSAEMADFFNTKFLGKMGIDPNMSKLGDQGNIEEYQTNDMNEVIRVVEGIVSAAPAPQFNSR